MNEDFVAFVQFALSVCSKNGISIYVFYLLVNNLINYAF